MNDKKIIAVDFDGTLCTDKYPEIGTPNDDVISIIMKLKTEGNLLILHTCRRDIYLKAAVDWCAAHGIAFDYINENAPHNIEKYGADTRKISADIYIDDKSINLQSLPDVIIEIVKNIAHFGGSIDDLLTALMDKSFGE